MKIRLLIGVCALSVWLGGEALAAQLVRQGTPHEALFSLAFEGDRGFAAGSLGSLYESRDKGLAWSEVEGPPTHLAILGLDVEEDRVLTVGQLGEIFVRDASGWRAGENDSRDRLFAAAFAGDGAAIAVGAFGTILRSSDDGDSWQRVDIDWQSVLPDGFEPHLYDIAIAADGSAVVVGEFSLVLRSVDRGMTWQVAHHRKASLFGVAFDGAVGLAVGQDGIVLRSVDNGRQWRREDSALTGNLVDVALKGETAVAVGVRVAGISHDRGLTWRAVDDPDIEDGWYPAAAVRPDGGGLVAGHAGRIVSVD